MEEVECAFEHFACFSRDQDSFRGQLVSLYCKVGPKRDPFSGKLPFLVS